MPPRKELLKGVCKATPPAHDEPSRTSAGACGGSQHCALLLLPLPEQFTSVGVRLVIDGLFEDAAEVERQPAERKDHHKAEDGLGHLPALQGEGGQDRRDGLDERWRAGGAKHHLPMLSKSPSSNFCNPMWAGHPPLLSPKHNLQLSNPSSCGGL